MNKLYFKRLLLSLEKCLHQKCHCYDFKQWAVIRISKTIQERQELCVYIKRRILCYERGLWTILLWNLGTSFWKLGRPEDIACIHVYMWGSNFLIGGEENQSTKRKTESYVFSGFSVSISLGWEWKSTTGRFVTCPFWPFTCGKTSFVGKDKVNKWEFCKLKITTIVVFVIMIRRIFWS